jgi:hypothetical protein
MRAVATPGRWIWGLSGLITTAALVVSGTALITSAGQAENAQPQSTATQTVTVPQPVTSLTVQSYGAPVEVTAAPVRHVRITETFTYGSQAGPVVASAVPTQPQSAPGGPLSGAPAVEQSVSDGRLSLAEPACETSDCSVSFAVAVPPDVTATVATQGGPITVSGIAGANLDSGSGPVSASKISGPLTVITGGGSLTLDGLAGPLSADTGGGPLSARALASTTATVITGSGDASVVFAAAPDSVTMSTDGGAAWLVVPGGPYALNATTDGGGPQSVGIATDPAAPRSITVISGGGSLEIEPTAGPLPDGNRARARSAEMSWSQPLQRVRRPDPGLPRNPAPAGVLGAGIRSASRSGVLIPIGSSAWR